MPHPLLACGNRRFVWDTNAVVDAISRGKNLDGVTIVRAQEREFERLCLPIPSRLKRIQGGRSVDGGLLKLSLAGYTVITMDRALTRRIRRAGGCVLHAREYYQAVLRGCIAVQ